MASCDAKRVLSAAAHHSFTCNSDSVVFTLKYCHSELQNKSFSTPTLGKKNITTFSASAFGVRMSSLYMPFFEGMGPAINKTLLAVRGISPAPRRILDLASGPGEPGCTIAAAFPSSVVICSDLAQPMVDLASNRAKSKGLQNVQTMLLDLTNMADIPSDSQDVVTAHFVITNVPVLQQALEEIDRVIRPGGFLIGTVWQSFSIIPLVNEVMRQIEQHDSVSSRSASPMRFADQEKLDKEFIKAGFNIMLEGHNQIGHITFDLGPIADDSAWMSAMVGKMKHLEEISMTTELDICKKTKEVVQRVAGSKGLIKDGHLCLPGIFRTFCLKTSL